jgi:hypothetical protein
MARKVTRLPVGYDILQVGGRYAPVDASHLDNGAIIARGFIRKGDLAKNETRAITYARRLYAAQFIFAYVAGSIEWAEVTPVTPERIQAWTGK